MKQFYTCDCRLRPQQHQVLKSERLSHQLALKQSLEEEQVSPIDVLGT
jgi:hypothetical protein